MEQYPIDYNTISNTSIHYGDSVYILAKSHSSTNYTLCSMQSYLNPNCSTQYNVSGTTGGVLVSHCEDPMDQYSYSRVNHSAGYDMSKDWATVASQWASALSLNDGVSNGNSSNARLLTQLVLTNDSLSPVAPSVGEALAVLSGCMLLLVSLNLPGRISKPSQVANSFTGHELRALCYLLEISFENHIRKLRELPSRYPLSTIYIWIHAVMASHPLLSRSSPRLRHQRLLPALPCLHAGFRHRFHRATEPLRPGAGQSHVRRPKGKLRGRTRRRTVKGRLLREEGGGDRSYVYFGRNGRQWEGRVEHAKQIYPQQ
jgi:hypothetical protein